jgi:hypothetical protein
MVEYDKYEYLLGTREIHDKYEYHAVNHYKYGRRLFHLTEGPVLKQS